MLVMGGMLLLFGIWALWSTLPDVRRRKRILDTPTSAIAAAPTEGLVEIKGAVVAEPGRLVRSPFRDLEAVVLRVIVEEYRSNGKSGSWRTLNDEIESRSFYVDDGSPVHARVDADGARLVLPHTEVCECGTFRDAPPALEAYLNARSEKSTGWFGFNRALRVREEVILPGDTLYALGEVDFEAGPQVEQGYRSRSTKRLVLSAGREELLLSTRSERDLVSELTWPYRMAVGLIAVGLGVCAYGLYAL